jgi:alpha-N-arabinofuranosidase
VGNPENSTEDFLAVTNSIDKQIEATDAVCRAAHHTKKTKKRVFLSFDEWNVWYKANGPAHTDGKGKFAPHLIEEVYNLEDALVAAGFLNSFIRHADSVKIANIAQIVNVIAPILTRGDDMLLQSIYYPFEMYSKRRNGVSLQTVVEGPGYVSPKHGEVKFVDASSILNGNELNVFLVNRSLTEEMEVEVRLADRSVKKLISGDFVTGNNPKAANTYEKKDLVTSCDHDDVCIKNGVATICIPPLCVYAGTLELG